MLSFNPRTHVGCDQYANYFAYYFNVSIHAPTWGATYSQFICRLVTAVSIHAPTWGATDTPRDNDNYSMFQSTHPRGVRPLAYRHTYRTIAFQSTHPRGVRLNIWFKIFKIRRFQSTHPRGVRRVGGDCKCNVLMFQSTHPRGVRLGGYYRSG